MERRILNALPAKQPAAGRRRTLTILAALLLAALALRSFHLDAESLWLDEAASWRFASGPLERALHAERTNPPLYYVLLHYWIGWFGSSEAAMRSLSIFPSLGSILLVYLLARRLFHNAMPALIAASYLAFSPFHLYYAQEARCFSMLLFFLLLSAWFMMRVDDATNRWSRLALLAGYVVATTLSLYTHFIALFYLASQGIYQLARSRLALKKIACWISGAACSVLLFLPWLLIAMRTAAGTGQARRYLLLKVPQTYFSFLFGDTLIPLDEQAVRSVGATMLAYMPVLLIAVLAVLALAPGIVRAVRRNPRAAWFLLVMSAAPVGMSLLLSVRTPMFDERYLIGSSPFLYIMIAVGIGFSLLERRGYVLAGLGALALTVLVAVSLYNYFWNPRFGREQWREAAALLVSKRSPADLVVFEPDYIATPMQYYAPVPEPVLRLHPAARKQFLDEAGTPLHGGPHHKRLWLIRSHYGDDAVLNSVSRNFKLVNKTVFHKAKGIEVFEFIR